MIYPRNGGRYQPGPGVPHICYFSGFGVRGVLKPLDAALKAQAYTRYLGNNLDSGNNDTGGESHLMGCIDDCGVVIPQKDVLLLSDEFNLPTKPLGYHLNPYKKRILISTSELSSLPEIEREYGMKVAADAHKAI